MNALQYVSMYAYHTIHIQVVDGMSNVRARSGTMSIHNIYIYIHNNVCRDVH